MPDKLEQTATDEKPILAKARKRLNQLRDNKIEKEQVREKGLESIKYFTGEDQGWDDQGARDTLKAAGRPALTLNRINPVIRLVCGARPRTEATFSPTEGGDLDVANILKACKEHVEKYNKWDFQEDDWFKWGIIKRGGHVVEIFPDFSRDIRGEVGMALHDRWEFLLDPDSKEKDHSDANDLIRYKSMSIEKATELFPEHKAVFESLSAQTIEGNEGQPGHDSGEADEYQDPKSNYYDSSSGSLTIYWYWYKERKRVTKIIDLYGGSSQGEQNPQATQESQGGIQVWESTKSVEVVKKEMAKFTADMDRFEFVAHDNITVKFIAFIHDTILEEGVTPWERDDGQPTRLSTSFPFLVFEPERLFAGAHQELVDLIDPMKDANKYHNKLASAILEIIGTHANSGWEYEEGALPSDDKAGEKLKKNASKPGALIKWAKNALVQGRAKKIQPGAPPAGHMQMSESFAREVLDISGVESLVSAESMGKGASGKAIDLRMTQGGNIISWVYTSFRYFQHVLLEYILDAIQVMYDYEKVMRVKGTTSKPDFVTINEVQYDMEGGIENVLNDVTIGNYDITVTDSEIMPTMRMERLKEFNRLAEKGLIPPPVVLKVFMHLADDPELKDIIDAEMEEFQKRATEEAQGGGEEQAAKALALKAEADIKVKGAEIAGQHQSKAKLAELAHLFKMDEIEQQQTG